MTSSLKSLDASSSSSLDAAATREIGSLWYSVYHDALVNSNIDLIHLVNFRITRRVSTTVWAEMKEQVTTCLNILIRNAEEIK